MLFLCCRQETSSASGGGSDSCRPHWAGLNGTRTRTSAGQVTPGSKVILPIGWESRRSWTSTRRFLFWTFFNVPGNSGGRRIPSSPTGRRNIWWRRGNVRNICCFLFVSLEAGRRPGVCHHDARAERQQQCPRRTKSVSFVCRRVGAAAGLLWEAVVLSGGRSGRPSVQLQVLLGGRGRVGRSQSAPHEAGRRRDPGRRRPDPLKRHVLAPSAQTVPDPVSLLRLQVRGAEPAAGDLLKATLLYEG